jgi:hypothetical protein
MNIYHSCNLGTEAVVYCRSTLWQVGRNTQGVEAALHYISVFGTNMEFLQSWSYETYQLGASKKINSLHRYGSLSFQNHG